MATALITGGTSGIGAAFARALAGQGEDLVLVARDAERLTSAAGDLADRFGVRVETLTADLGRADDVERVADRLVDAEAPISRLVNNAGFGVRSRLTAEDLSSQTAGIAVMISAVLRLGGAAGRVMKARGAGSIINVSSTAGFMTMGGYSAIKAWVTVYSEALSVELAPRGVHVTALCPGWVRTEFHSRAEIKVGGIPEVLWLDADEVVADGLRDNARGKVISIPSRRYQTIMFVARHAPRSVIRTVSRRLSSNRH